MTLTAGVAIYFLIWWVVLFAVLPWGARSQAETGEVTSGTEPGAPVSHRIRRTLVWTTLIASALFAVLWAVYAAGWLPVDILLALTWPPHH